jgi:hypothetical protein
VKARLSPQGLGEEEHWQSQWHPNFKTRSKCASMTMAARSMRRFAITVISGCLLIGACCTRASADMGRLFLVERHGDHRISVFISPDPLRAGPIDISVLLQDAETGQPVDDAHVTVQVTSSDGSGRIIQAVATHAAATNKLLRAALIELPSPGSWDVEIAYIAGRNPARQLRFTIEAGQQMARWLTMWPWFGWPAAVVLLYGVHRWLASQGSSRGARD